MAENVSESRLRSKFGSMGYRLSLDPSESVGLRLEMPHDPQPSTAKEPPIFATRLQRFVDQQMTAGAVLLVGNQTEIQHLEALGWADIQAGQPMQVDNLFWIASITKPVTGVALMMLVDEGLLSVDEPAEKYIPGFARLMVEQPDGSLLPPSHPILIRELLTHTSGMRFLNTKDKQIIDSVPLAVSVEHSLLEPLLSDPGTRYSYSNEGIDACGRILEIVTGVPFESFLQERIFTPLGMKDTTFFPDAKQIARLAQTYRVLPDGGGLEKTRTDYLTYPLDLPARYPAPGGGLFSTATDVYLFARMLVGGGLSDSRRYLSDESFRQMTTKQTGPNIPDAYGFGIGASEDGSHFGHGGALKTVMVIDRGEIRVYLTQETGVAAENPAEIFHRHVRELYPKEDAVQTKTVGVQVTG